MKSRLAVVFVTLLGALTLGAAVASGDNADNAKATIWAGKGDCGSPVTAPFTDIGFVNFHRVGNTVSINVHLKDGTPDATYNVFLFGGPGPASPCGPAGQIDGNLGTVTTNDSGVGNGHFTIDVPAADTLFWADPTVSPSPFAPSNDTTTVTLS